MRAGGGWVVGVEARQGGVGLGVAGGGGAEVGVLQCAAALGCRGVMRWARLGWARLDERGQMGWVW